MTSWNYLPKSPVAIARIGSFLDGGTTFVVLDDTNRILSLCFDYRVGSNTLGSIYLGGAHPCDNEAILVPRGSIVEKTIITILSNFLEDDSSKLFSLQERQILRDRIDKVLDPSLLKDEDENQLDYPEPIVIMMPESVSL